MREHHQRAIQRLTDTFRDDPRFLALIIGGSVAKGREKEDSDIDFMLVATDEEYARRKALQEFHYFSKDLCDYPGGYVDGKVVDMQFIRDVAERGSEAARFAFAGAILAFSRLPELDGLLQRIPVYQEHEQRQKVESFYSQVLLLNWFIPEAEKRNDRYLLTWAATNMVLFGGRLILAHNRILFPYHKWFMYDVKRAPDKPANFVELAEALLASPGQAAAQAFCDCISNYRDWGVSFGQAVVKFMEDAEWTWRSGKLALQDV